MRLLILNGPNINMIGIRNHDLYGNKSYKELINEIKAYCIQEKIINYLQKNYNKFDSIVANLGAFTHYSYAIRDAIELTNAKIAEVHISDINNREPFRKNSVIEDISLIRIIGKGTDGYLEAIKLLEDKKDE